MSTACVIALALIVPGVATAQESKQETLTAKERSSRKWFDEQRVDNCRVPLEKRGATPRPGCRGEQATATR